jgi:hypothetical protein
VGDLGICPSTLSDVIARTDAVAIACSKCDRAAQYPMATLIERYGPQFAVDGVISLDLGAHSDAIDSQDDTVASRDPSTWYSATS